MASWSLCTGLSVCSSLQAALLGSQPLAFQAVTAGPGGCWLWARLSLDVGVGLVLVFSPFHVATISVSLTSFLFLFSEQLVVFETKYLRPLLSLGPRGPREHAETPTVMPCRVAMSAPFCCVASRISLVPGAFDVAVSAITTHGHHLGTGAVLPGKDPRRGSVLSTQQRHAAPHLPPSASELAGAPCLPGPGDSAQPLPPSRQSCRSRLEAQWGPASPCGISLGY